MSTTSLHHVNPSAVRKSIKKLFPLGSVFCKGSNNPVTMHAADDDAFARVWSCVAETMIVKNGLSRNVKEKIAALVSKMYQCPVCILAHNMMVEGSEEKHSPEEDDRSLQTLRTVTQEDFEKLVLEYTDVVVRATWAQDNSLQAIKDDDDNDFSMLHDKTKAEIALVVMLTAHINRSVDALVGTEMSTALFMVPRPVARAVETSSIMNTINRLMAPIINGVMVAKVEAGCTDYLFSKTKKRLSHSSAAFEVCPALPTHLESIKVTGEARARAVGRLVEWSEVYYETELKVKGVLPDSGVLSFLDEDPTARPPKEAGQLSHKIVTWISSDMRVFVRGMDIDDLNKNIVIVLLYVSYAPKAIEHSAQWQTLVRLMGDRRARALVIWWSVRYTLRQAKGLE